MLIKKSERDVISMLEVSVRHMCLKGWETNPLKIQRPDMSVVFRDTVVKGMLGYFF